MATKGDPKGKGQAFRDSLKASTYQSNFVRFNLSEDHKKAIKAWGFDPELFETAMLRLVDGGYKITFRFDEMSSAYACWFVAPLKDHENAAYILSGRGSTPLKAFKQALYQHTVLFDEDWPKANPPRSPDDIDD